MNDFHISLPRPCGLIHVRLLHPHSRGADEGSKSTRVELIEYIKHSGIKLFPETGIILAPRSFKLKQRLWDESDAYVFDESTSGEPLLTIFH
jgi:hypothetical protein